MKKLAVLAICLALSQLALGQDLAIVNARIIDGSGRAIEHGGIAVTDGRIVAVGEVSGQGSDVPTIDAGGMTMMPGMINTHWHLFAGSAAGSDEALERYRTDGVIPTLENILERGVTTIMSPGDHFPAILEVRRMLAAGDVRGPRLVVVGPVFTASNDWPTQICDGDAACNSMLNAVVDDEEAARAMVQQLATAGVDALKLVYDDVIAPDVRIRDGVVSALAVEAERHDLRLLAHLSSTTVPAARLLELGVDGFVHSAMDITGAIEDMNAGRTPVITTATVNLPVAERAMLRDPDFVPASPGYFNRSLGSIGTLFDNGVPVAFGTDSVAGPPGLSAGFLAATDSGEGLFIAEIRALSRVLSNEQIIQSLTANAALAVGLAGEIGTLEPGKAADIILVDGDPMENIEDLAKVRLVIQGGIVTVDRR